ncbi:hypothetical protein PV327_004061 [Microctonus hyperodae]|uniref:Aspartic peptidase DDI1-type domain-containing protein n=1 Tax=Microctonus hyperodae TaxID=165561 RepID=A0AA39FBM1_MICHY|nr:hypothetical protein PV327_004061 [Microctonus hyperodae]
MGNREWRALIDSGAMSSFINRNTWKEIEKLRVARLQPTQLKVTVADGRSAKIIGQITCPVIVNGGRYILKFHVIPDLNEEMLFGIDTLKQLNCQLDFGQMISRVNEIEDSREPLTGEQAKQTIESEMKSQF